MRGREGGLPKRQLTIAGEVTRAPRKELAQAEKTESPQQKVVQAAALKETWKSVAETSDEPFQPLP